MKSYRVFRPHALSPIDVVVQGEAARDELLADLKSQNLTGDPKVYWHEVIEA